MFTMPPHPSLSVLTPTFNRAPLLERVYRSLARQTVRDFEWVVVDDGSTDATPLLIAQWQTQATFPIIWCQSNKNRGKNAAVNAGLAIVKGDYTLLLDSDDELLDQAIEEILHWRRATGIDANSSIFALFFRYFNEKDCLVGNVPKMTEALYKDKILKVVRLEGVYRLGLMFDCLVVVKTRLIQKLGFIELTDREHGQEIITWNKLRRNYDSIYVNQALGRVHRKHGLGRLSDGPATSTKWPRGNYLWFLSVLNDDLQYLRYNPRAFWNCALKITRLGLHIGRPIRQQYCDLRSPLSRLLWVAAMGSGWLHYVVDRLRGRSVPLADSDISAWEGKTPSEDWKVTLYASMD